MRVHQWSAGSYLEDQDMWWLSGIFRAVTLEVRPAGGIDDAGLHKADLRPLGQQAASGGEEPRIREERVVVEEEQHVSAHLGHPPVASGGDAEVLGEVQRLHARGKGRVGGGRVPAVPYAHHVDLDPRLVQHAPDAADELVRTRSHREHDDADARPPGCDPDPPVRLGHGSTP